VKIINIPERVFSVFGMPHKVRYYYHYYHGGMDGKFYFLPCCKTKELQKMVPARVSASPGNFLEAQTFFRFYPKLSQSEILQVEPSDLFSELL
jgi:hypothetical protein